MIAAARRFSKKAACRGSQRPDALSQLLACICEVGLCIVACLSYIGGCDCYFGHAFAKFKGMRQQLTDKEFVMTECIKEMFVRETKVKKTEQEE